MRELRYREAALNIEDFLELDCGKNGTIDFPRDRRGLEMVGYRVQGSICGRWVVALEEIGEREGVLACIKRVSLLGTFFNFSTQRPSPLVLIAHPLPETRAAQ